MFITKDELFQAAKMAILESSMEKGIDQKEFILNEMTFDQAMNTVFNPDKTTMMEGIVLEQWAYDIVKSLEEAKVELLEHNKGKKQSVVKVLKEHFAESILEGITTDRTPEEEEQRNANAQKYRDSKKPEPKESLGTKVGNFINPLRSPILQKSAEFTKDFAKTGGGMAAIGTGLAATGLGAYGLHKWRKNRKAKKELKAQRKHELAVARAKAASESLQESVTLENIQATNVLAARTLGYGAYTEARKRHNRANASFIAASTMESLSEMALRDGEWDLHILSLQEAKKWVERGFDLT